MRGSKYCDYKTSVVITEEFSVMVNGYITEVPQTDVTDEVLYIPISL